MKSVQPKHQKRERENNKEKEKRTTHYPDVATMTDDCGVTLRYMSRQHSFKTKRIRFHKVLEKEKKAAKITALETKLSEHFSKTNDVEAFWKYLEKEGVRQVSHWCLLHEGVLETEDACVKQEQLRSLSEQGG